LNIVFVLKDAPDLKRAGAFIRANWQALASTDRPLTLIVTDAQTKRTDAQNRALHALLRTMAESVWVDGQRFSADAWKELVRRRFIGTEEVTLPDGSRVERGISTTALSVAEFSDLLDAMAAWIATDYGVDLNHNRV
jgi:hypothetical protein